MAYPRNYSGPHRNGQRPPPYPRYQQYDYDEQVDRNPRGRPYRDYSPSRRSPPHERRRTPPRGNSSRGDPPDSREWDRRRDDWDDRDTYSRGRPPQHRPAYREYRDRDREGYRSPEADSRSHSRSRSRSPRRARSPYYGGPPTREVMMDGLPVDMVEEDISKELKNYHEVDDLEDVRIIKDRQTKLSRGFGFLRFSSVETAKAFLEQNYPTLHLYGDDSADGNEKVAKIRICFSREREDKGPPERSEGEWTCRQCSFVNFATRKLCLRCQIPFSEMNNINLQKQPEFLNSGDSDVSVEGSPSQFLLIRSLEPTVTEELLAKGVTKLYKPNPANAQVSASTKKGNAKVSSTTGDANLGAKEGSLRRVLLVRDRRTAECWRYGFAEFQSVDDAQAALTRYNSFEKFTISSKPVLVSYIHTGVFVPVFDFLQTPEHFCFSPFGNTATRLRYWDENAYVSELVVNKQQDDIVTSEARVDPASAVAQDEEATGKEDVDGKAKKRKAEAKAGNKQKKTVPAHLQFWSSKHAELHNIQSSSSKEDSDSNADAKTGQNEKHSLDAARPPQQSYAHPEKMCCYLCSRQFKSSTEVNKHERLSQLHRDNLKNDELKTKALAKLEKNGISPRAHHVEAEESTPEYRDRAKERRAAFGPSKVSLPMKKKSDAATVHPSTSSPPKEDLAAQTATSSKGAALLGKMGWTSGKGLGAQGEGLAAPIATDMYVAGVGLGAQGGKVGDATEEADRNTRSSYSDFLERTKDKAKERFERMN